MKRVFIKMFYIENPYSSKLFLPVLGSTDRPNHLTLVPTDRPFAVEADFLFEAAEK